MIITIDSIQYNINWKNENTGTITKITYPMKPGDVYVDPKDQTNPLLLVQVTYGKREDTQWVLLGMGCTPNSNPFYRKTHSFDEIVNELSDDGMVFSHNINGLVASLLHQKPK